MEFGLFAEQTRRGADQAEAFREMFDLADAAESWGLDVFWLAEMLMNPARSVLSAPLLVASFIVAPLRMAATTAETFPRVARMGLPIFVGLRGMSIPELAEHLRVYRQAWRDAGHPGDGDACLRIPLYAAPTEKAAVDEPKETITYYFQRQADLTRAPLGRAGTGPVERRVAQAQRLSGLSYDEILTTKVAFGTGPGLVDRFTQLKEELGVNGIAAELNAGGLLSTDQEMRSLKILLHEVAPAFK
jgi:alkanesulfonate monooxygenase SsuD/methylene tetrahydromethanopterin reductase-like flavin-dependent oxidoreductase (luciferase family)